MRTIKFKALDELGAWVYGIPQTSSTLHLNLDSMAQYFSSQRRYGRESVTIKPETLGQFTGLLDKNENEIYEGDIVKCGYGVGKVIFNAGCFMVCWIDDPEANMEILSCRKAMYKRKDEEEFEVVGNIHENNKPKTI